MSSLALCSTKNFNSWLWHLVLYFTFVFAFVFGSAGCLSLPRSTKPPRTSIVYLGASRPSPSPLGLLRPKQTLCLEEPTTTLMHQQHQRNRASCMETTEYIQITHQLLHRTNFTKHHPADFKDVLSQDQLHRTLPADLKDVLSQDHKYQHHHRACRDSTVPRASARSPPSLLQCSSRLGSSARLHGSSSFPLQAYRQGLASSSRSFLHLPGYHTTYIIKQYIYQQQHQQHRLNHRHNICDYDV